ncbi:MAG TPA: hypothetical protein DCO75_08505 [Fibrobacteres bacterium]|nr:hypothetical protein [Fibrobacterota bacterium]
MNARYRCQRTCIVTLFHYIKNQFRRSRPARKILYIQENHINQGSDIFPHTTQNISYCKLVFRGAVAPFIGYIIAEKVSIAMRTYTIRY